MTSSNRNRNGPLYRQIADDLKEHIGELGSGTRIPSEHRLAKDWGVSRFTVAKAFEQLVEERLITRRQGSGSFVAEAPLRQAPGYLLSFTEAVEAAGRKPSHKLLAFVPAEWQESYPFSSDTKLVLLDRLRLVDGIAVARHRSILSADLVHKIGLTKAIASERRFSLYRHFEEHGLSIHRATERLVACAAADEDRALLSLTGDAVVVAVNRNSFAADGTLLDSVSAIYDARRYSYEARLFRQHHLGKKKSDRENDHDAIFGDRRGHVGPRLGPWSSNRDGG
jgi:GntR family transcriptional regulator